MAADRENLCADHLAGALDAAGRAELADHLAADPALRAGLARQVAVDRWLRASRTPVDVEQVMRALPVEGHLPTRVLQRTRRQAPARRWIRLLPLAAAALLIIALGVVWSRQQRAPDDLRLAGSQGGVSGTVAVGDRLVLADGAFAELIAGDGSHLSLRGPGSLAIDAAGDGSGMHLTLASGILEADIRPRPAERPLVVATPHGSATVVGTRFSLTVGTGSTRLAVQEGTVEFAGGGEVIHVGAGHAAVLPPPQRLLAVADGTLDAARAAGGLGALPELEVRTAEPERLACLRFALPPGRIVSAQLVLTRLRGQGAVAVHRTNGAWDEALLRHFHVPERGERIGVLADGTDRLDVTAACRDGTCDLTLVGELGTDCAFASREADAGGPILLVSIDPL